MQRLERAQDFSVFAACVAERSQKKTLNQNERAFKASRRGKNNWKLSKFKVKLIRLFQKLLRKNVQCVAVLQEEKDY